MKNLLNRFYKIRFSPKLLIATIVFVAVISNVWFLLNLVADTKKVIKSNLEIELANLERKFIDITDHTYSIIRNINLQIAKDPNNKKYIEDILKRYPTSKDLSNKLSWTIFSWSDHNFYITVDAKEGIMKPFDISPRGYSSLMELYPDSLQVSSPVIGATSRKWMIPGGVGLSDEDGNYLGSTIIGFDIEKLARIMHQTLKNPKVKFSVYSNREVSMLYGDIASYHIGNSIDDDIVYNLNISKWLQKLNSSGEGKVFDISLIKEPHAFLARKITNFPYIIALQYDKDEIRQELYTIIKDKLVQIGSVLFGLVIILSLIFNERRRSSQIFTLKEFVKNADESKANFLSRASHELQNFIFGIQGCAEIIQSDLRLIRSKIAKNKDLAKYIDKESISHDLELTNNIIESSNNLDDFMSDLVTFNNAESGQLRIIRSKSEIDITPILKQRITKVKKRADALDIILISKISKDLHKISKIDKNRLGQVFSRLLNNAIKYSHESGIIEITAKNITDKNQIDEFNKKTGFYKSKLIEITVEDHGRGFSKREIDNALKRTGAVKNVTSTKQANLGLGLPIIKYLIEKQSGSFEIKSQLHQGTKTIITL